MDDIDELIKRSKAALLSASKPKKLDPDLPTGYPSRALMLPASVFHPPRYAKTDGAKHKQILHIYKPLHIPEPIDNGYIILHGHWPELMCKPEYMCHIVGFTPVGEMVPQFNSVWRHLYNQPTTSLGEIDLGF